MKIQFEAGQSRHGEYSVNYLISEPGSDPVLYAEAETPEGASDDYGYLTLKAEIIRQAEAAGIPVQDLTFWYDGQEQYLAPDASAACDVKAW